jgi:hypothetical protein
MVLMKVKYDAYNRHFRVFDHELARTLQDGETYVLIADLPVKDSETKPPADISLKTACLTCDRETSAWFIAKYGKCAWCGTPR